jgi:hypothetical protein
VICNGKGVVVPSSVEFRAQDANVTFALADHDEDLPLFAVLGDSSKPRASELTLRLSLVNAFEFLLKEKFIFLQILEFLSKFSLSSFDLSAF